jgi:hypothetical protein
MSTRGIMISHVFVSSSRNARSISSRSCSSISPSVWPSAVSCRISVSVIVDTVSRRSGRSRASRASTSSSGPAPRQQQQRRRDRERDALPVVRRDPHRHQLAEVEHQEGDGPIASARPSSCHSRNAR